MALQGAILHGILRNFVFRMALDNITYTVFGELCFLYSSSKYAKEAMRPCRKNNIISNFLFLWEQTFLAVAQTVLTSSLFVFLKS